MADQRTTGMDAAAYERIDGMLAEITETARTLKAQGRIHALSATQVKVPIPIGTEIAGLAQLAAKYCLPRSVRPAKSALGALLFEYTTPTDTGFANAYVEHTKSAFGVIPGTTLPASRELLLAIKMAQSSTPLQPKDIFRMSLEATAGDYPSSMLTVHNLLKELAYSSRSTAFPVPLNKLFLKLPPGETPQSLKDEYTTAFARLGLPLECLTLDGNSYIGQKQSDHTLADKLESLRPEGDENQGDKLGPWYHLFGPLFVSSIDVGGRYMGELLAYGEGSLRHVPYFSRPDGSKEYITDRGAGVVAGDVLDVISGTDHQISRFQINEVLNNVNDSAPRQLGLQDKTWKALLGDPSFLARLRSDLSSSKGEFELIKGLQLAAVLERPPYTPEHRQQHDELIARLDGRFANRVKELLPDVTLANATPEQVARLKQRLVEQIRDDCDPGVKITCRITLIPPTDPKAAQPIAGQIRYGARPGLVEEINDRRVIELPIQKIRQLDSLIEKGGKVTVTLTAPVKATSTQVVGALGFSYIDGKITDLLEFRIPVAGFQKGDSGGIDERFLLGEQIQDKDTGPATVLGAGWSAPGNPQQFRMWSIIKCVGEEEAIGYITQQKALIDAGAAAREAERNDPDMLFIDRSSSCKCSVIGDYRVRARNGDDAGSSTCNLAVVYRDDFVIVWGAAEQFHFDLAPEYQTMLKRCVDLIDARFPSSTDQPPA